MELNRLTTRTTGTSRKLCGAYAAVLMQLTFDLDQHVGSECLAIDRVCAVVSQILLYQPLLIDAARNGRHDSMLRGLIADCDNTQHSIRTYSQTRATRQHALVSHC